MKRDVRPSQLTPKSEHCLHQRHVDVVEIDLYILTKCPSVPIIAWSLLLLRDCSVENSEELALCGQGLLLAATRHDEREPVVRFGGGIIEHSLLGIERLELRLCVWR